MILRYDLVAARHGCDSRHRLDSIRRRASHGGLGCLRSEIPRSIRACYMGVLHSLLALCAMQTAMTDPGGTCSPPVHWRACLGLGPASCGARFVSWGPCCGVFGVTDRVAEARWLHVWSQTSRAAGHGVKIMLGQGCLWARLGLKSCEFVCQIEIAIPGSPLKCLVCGCCACGFS